MGGKKPSAGGQLQLTFDGFPENSDKQLCQPDTAKSTWTPPQKSDDAKVLTVFELAQKISETLDTPLLTNVTVAGEITGYRPHSSGHLYFSLSEHGDEKATIPCVMWKFAAKSLTFPIKDGGLVHATGYVDYYPPFGKLQFIIKKLELGTGGKTGLYLQKESWKKQLEEEGIIPRKEIDKRCLPLFPTKIGVVTSRTGSVLQDIKNVISRRYPLPIILAHTSVQGEGAHHEIAAAINSLQEKVDVIIVGRGGGSFEDLFEFNHPDVVKAIASSKVPIISAVGHETDTTLSDFAADLRAPTPSAAAETVVPDRTVLLKSIEDLRRVLYDRMNARFVSEKKILHELTQRIDSEKLSRKLNQMRSVIAEFEERLTGSFQRKVSGEKDLCRKLSEEIFRGTKNKIFSARQTLLTEKEIILARDPYKPLELGYALIVKEGTVVRSVKNISVKDKLSLKLSDGDVTAKVENIYERTN